MRTAARLAAREARSYRVALLLRIGHGRTVVILSDSDTRREVVGWKRRFRLDRVHVLVAADDFGETLKLIGPVDILVDALPGTAAEHERRWEKLFCHVEQDGVYLVDRRLMTGDARTWMRRLRARGRARRRARGNDRLAEAAAVVFQSRRTLLIRQRLHHYLKLRDDEVTRVLAAREPQIRVTELGSLPAGELVSKAEVVSHESAVPIRKFSGRMPHPRLQLRHYEGRVTFAGFSLVYTEGCVLPETFRWYLKANPSIPRVRDTAPLFAALPPRMRATETLPGSYFHVDPNFIGHFGHFLTESISRLWGWDEAKAQNPELKAIYRVRDLSTVEKRFEWRLLRAYGIAAEDIVAVDRPVHLTSLVGATPMWHNSTPYFAHPALTDVWDRISGNLIDPAAPTFERVFISRADSTSPRRRCRNIGEVEQLFAAHGFEIIYPEKLDLGIQAAIFANASVVAGFVGSAMFNLMHAKRLKTLILLSHESYTARNEHLYTSLLGGSVHYFWSTADVSRAAAVRRKDAFQSAWEFDFARNGKSLERLLDSL